MREIKKKLGDILVSAGKITNVQLEEALRLQNQNKKKIGEVLVEMGTISEDEILNTLSVQLSISRVNLEDIFIDSDLARTIPKEVAKKYSLIPIYMKDGKLVVAMSDPLNVYALDDVKFITHRQIEPVISNKKSIDRVIELYLSKQATDRAIEDLKKEYNFSVNDKVEHNTDEDIQNAPAVRLTNSIINQAINIRASDIHIEPFQNSVSVRYRVDGVLSESARIPQNLYSSVSTRIKIMAGMNIAEKRIPQDGRIEMEVGTHSYDFRVSSLPTVFGEKIVIRILDRSSFLFDRMMLGFDDAENKLIDKLIGMPHGILLLTGPTGSGKTTTLYTMLNELNSPEKNIVTVEDPVEYMLDGINQVQVNNKAGLSFAAGLRSILRQDPDIIMIGEIRDEETAQIAVRSAITGHLVLSTLHTNDAPGAITRLVDMSVEAYLVADAVVGVIAQRLVRKLCVYCKRGKYTDDKDMRLMQLEEPVEIFEPVGCPVCNNSGYKGRTAIHEVMLIESEHRMLIERGGDIESLRTLAVNKGMVNLFENCKKMVIKGETSINEMARTVYARD